MYDAEIIVLKQTGVGSERDNVIQIGKFDMTIIPVNADTNIKYNETEKVLDNRHLAKLN